MKKTRVLVAGVGNVFFGDDGFGVEVARVLRRRVHSDEVCVADYGIRALHLAFALVNELELLIVVDAVYRGGRAGTLYLLEPHVAEVATLSGSPGNYRESVLDDATTEAPEPHAQRFDISSTLALARHLGARLPRVRLVGCEPAAMTGMSLSPEVSQAVEPAVDMILRLLENEVYQHDIQPNDAA